MEYARRKWAIKAKVWAVKPANLIKSKNSIFSKFPEVPRCVREYMHGGYAPDRYVDSSLTSWSFNFRVRRQGRFTYKWKLYGVHPGSTVLIDPKDKYFLMMGVDRINLSHLEPGVGALLCIKVEDGRVLAVGWKIMDLGLTSIIFQGLFLGCTQGRA